MKGDVAERRAAAAEALEKAELSARLVREAGLEIEVLTGGGTGTSAIDAAAGGLTELQPGSYIFMDTNYSAIGWEGRAQAALRERAHRPCRRAQQTCVRPGDPRFRHEGDQRRRRRAARGRA